MVTACCLEHVCNEFGRDGCAGFIFFVLSGVGETGYYGRYSAGRGRATCIYHDEKFHEMVVDAICAGLNNEDIFIANGFPSKSKLFQIGGTDCNGSLAV